MKVRDTFEELMSEPATIDRHRTEPLVQEREAFLRYLRDTCGTGLRNIRTTACYLLQIVRLLRLRDDGNRTHRTPSVTKKQVRVMEKRAGD